MTKSALTDIRVAEELFRYYLPTDILSYIDLKTLKLSSNSYVGHKLQQFFSDIVYEVQIDGELGYLCIILEHKSHPDRWVPLQTHHYTAQAMFQFHKQHPNEKLPLFYPIILYNGKTPFTHSLELKDLINAPAELINKCFLKPPHLLDLTQFDNEALKQHTWSGAVLLSLKNIFARDLLAFVQANLTDIFRILIQTKGEFVVRDMLEYYIYKGSIGDSDQFYNYITQQLSKEIGDDMATLAQQWEEQGYQKGRHEGIEEGIEKMARNIAKKLLTEGKRVEEVAQITNLPISIVIAMKKHIQGVVA